MTAGVYVLYGRRNVVLYVGQSRNCEKRIDQHRRAQEWAGEIFRTEISPIVSAVAAIAHERQVIRALTPRYNTCRYTSRPRQTRYSLPHDTAQLLRSYAEQAWTAGRRTPADQRLSDLIALLRDAGWTLQAIGSPLGITREAVRLRARLGRVTAPDLPTVPQPERWVAA